MNTRHWRMFSAVFLSCFTVLFLAGTPAWAGTLEDITTALSSNANAVSDFSADLAIDATNNNYDITGGWVKCKDQSTPGTSKFRVHSGTGADAYCDGSNVMDSAGTQTRATFVTNNYDGWLSRAVRDTDIRWLLANNTFSLDPNDYTIDSVTCKLITSTTYDIYVNSSNYMQAKRIDAKEGGSVKRRYTMSQYSYVKSTAWLPGYVVATDSPGDNTCTYNITYSNMSINDNLADSWFTLPS